MTPIWIIATNTFRQTVRQRLFLNVGVFGIGLVMLSTLVGGITYGFADRVVRSIGLSGVAIALDLMALLVSVSLIYEEIDRKTLFVVLTRPVERWQYAVGRYLGLILALMLALVGLSVVFLIALYSSPGGQARSTDFLALACALPEAAVLAAFGLVLSAFSTPTLSAGIGVGFWIAAATTDDLLRLSSGGDASLQWLAKACYYALPSLARLNFRTVAVYDLPVSFGEVASAVGYGCGYSFVLLMLASLILSRREMV